MSTPIRLNVAVILRLPSGNLAMYSVDPDHIDDAVQLGKQLAHEFHGQWFFPGGWIRIQPSLVDDLKAQCLELQ